MLEGFFIGLGVGVSFTLSLGVIAALYCIGKAYDLGYFDGKSGREPA